MSTQEKLLNLIHNEVIPDIEDYLDQLFEMIAAKKGNDEMKEEIKHMQEMKKDFTELIEEINNEEITEDECKEIIDEIIEMKSIQE